MVWHWFNYDWRSVMLPLLGSTAFKFFSEFRLWVYEYAPDLPSHGFVRVTYRSNLLRELNSREPEMKPHSVGPSGALITKPEGLLFMNENVFFNPRSPAPLKEAWKPPETNSAEGARAIREEGKPWNMDKVLKHVQKTAENFSAGKQHQWAAMREFHRLYPTSDVLPTFPLSIAVPGCPTVYRMEQGPCEWTA